jgi:hypothetical protein
MSCHNAPWALGRPIWQGIFMDSLKFHPGLSSLTLLRPVGRPARKTALWPFLGWPAHRTGGLRPSSTPLDTPCRTSLSGPRSWILQGGLPSARTVGQGGIWPVAARSVARLSSKLKVGIFALVIRFFLESL